MTSQRKRQIFNAVGILLSALFLYFCFHSIDREGLKQAFLVPRPWLLAAVVGLNFFAMGLRALSWRILLKPLQPLPFWTLFDLMHVGYMANNLLPLKAGEFFRASFIAKKWNIPYTQVLTTVGLDRYFSGFSLILILIAVASFLPVPLWIKSGAYVMGAVLLGVQASLILIWKRKPNLEKWESRHPIIYKIIEFLFHVGEGSQLLRSFNSFIFLLFVAFIVWGMQVEMLRLIEIAFGKEIPWVHTIFVLVAINLAISLPSAPGNLGTFELATVLAYTSMGMDKPTALGIAFYFHFLQVIPVTLVGLFYYFRWGIRLKELGGAVEQQAEMIPYPKSIKP